MPKLYLCTLEDPKSPENNHFTLQNIKAALAKEDIEFIDPQKVKEMDVKENSILYFTINADGIDKYKELIDPQIHLISWITGDFTNVIKAYQMHKIPERLILLSSSRIWLDLLKRLFPDSIVKYMHSGYNPEIFSGKKVKKTSDISFFIEGKAPGVCEKELKSVFDESLYKILNEMMFAGIRNPGVNIYNIINQFEICYETKFSNDKRLSDNLGLIEEYMYIHKQLNLLKALSEYKVNVWGPEFVKDYVTGKQKYNGAYSDSQLPELAEKSRIVINVDPLSPLLGYKEKTINLIASSAITLTDDNLILKESLIKDDYKYYYFSSNYDQLKELLNSALANYAEEQEQIIASKAPVLETLTWSKKLEFLVKI